VTGPGGLVSLRAADRREVLWVGGNPPIQFMACCEARQLTVRPITLDQLSIAAPTARAILVEAHGDPRALKEQISPHFQLARIHGLAIALVVPPAHPDLPMVPNPEILTPFYNLAVELGTVLFYADWNKAAQWASQYSPGPGANLALTMRGDVPTDNQKVILLQRACHDLNGVTLKVMADGKSGALVLQASPSSEDLPYRSLPLVAKIHDKAKMDTERSNVEVLRNVVPHRLFAGLDPERCCMEGDTLGLVVYEVVDNARPFREIVFEGIVSPAALMESLFDRTLGGCRMRRHGVKRSLSVEFGEGRLKCLRLSPELRQAFELARATAVVPQIDELWEYLRSMPVCTFQAGTVHGDPHVGNLFVPDKTSDVQLIDYGSVLSEAALAADPACLEVSMTFPFSVSDRSQRDPDFGWRRETYQFPLVLECRSSNRMLNESVVAIRRAAGAVEPDPAVYGFAVGSYLLRYASHAGHSSDQDRALAYELGANLVMAAAGSGNATASLAQLQ
jgi:hypothetical protein